MASSKGLTLVRLLCPLLLHFSAFWWCSHAPAKQTFHGVIPCIPIMLLRNISEHFRRILDDMKLERELQGKHPRAGAEPEPHNFTQIHHHQLRITI
jgi:hypothetical protein